MKTISLINMLSGREGSPLRATLRRELRSTLLNRYGQSFCVLALAGGSAAVVLSEDPGAIVFFLLHVSLYLVSLFALLAGVSSARAESEEWPLLLAQPIARSAIVIGKVLALTALSALALALMFAPAMIIGGTSIGGLFSVYVQTLALATVFCSIGLCCGFLASDRVQGLVLSVAVWLFLLVGLDLVALAASQWPAFQRVPNAWIAALMLNPLDAFRIQTLFSLGQIPPESADKAPLAFWWLGHPGAWLAVLTGTWIAAAIALASWRLRRIEP